MDVKEKLMFLYPPRSQAGGKGLYRAEISGTQA